MRPPVCRKRTRSGAFPGPQSTLTRADTADARRIDGRHRDRLRQAQPGDAHHILDCAIHPQAGSRQPRPAAQHHAPIFFQLDFDLAQLILARARTSRASPHR